MGTFETRPGSSTNPSRLWAAAAVLIAVALAPAARAATDAEVVATVNAIRAADGMPAIALNPAKSDGCAKHLNYLVLNPEGGRYLGVHGERPELPGYTPEGADSAGEILAFGGSLPQGLTPWFAAPLHERTYLTPWIGGAGYAELPVGWICLRVSGGAGAGSGTRMYSHPGNGATIEPQASYGEQPYVPQELVGIPQLTQTGPTIHLFVAAAGRTGDYSVASATLAGPDGAVDILPIDHHSSATLQSRTFTGPSDGGYLIVPKPLKPRTSYRAEVRWTRDPTAAADVPATLEQAFSFTTTGRLNLTVARVEGEKGAILIQYSGLLGGYDIPPTARAVLTGPGAERRDVDIVNPAFTWVRGVSAGAWNVCVTTGGPGTEWEQSESCSSVNVAAASDKTGTTSPSPPDARKPTRLRITKLTKVSGRRRSTVAIRGTITGSKMAATGKLTVTLRNGRKRITRDARAKSSRYSLRVTGVPHGRWTLVVRYAGTSTTRPATAQRTFSIR